MEQSNGNRHKDVEVDENPPEKGKVLPQFVAGVTANLMAVVVGCIMGWTSPSMTYLEALDSPVGRPITTDENSWISSLMPLSAAVGPFAAGFFADRLGRKRSLILAAVPVIISYTCLAVAEEVWVIYLGRIIAGFSLGWTFTVLPMYIGEIAEKQFRGAMGSMLQFFLGIGFLYDYCLGPYVPYIWLSATSIIFPVLFIVCFIFVPESPYYLLMKGRDDEATNSLKWLRGKSAAGVATELKIMKAEVDDAVQNAGGFTDIFNKRTNRKSVLLCMGLVSFSQLSGVNLVLFNAQSIFAKAGGSITADVSTIITGAVLLFASIPTPFMVEKFGRKILLITSGVGMAISLAVVGVCFFLASQDIDTENFSFLPVVGVIAFLSFYSPGFGPIPWAVMGEMYPANIKALGSTLAASAAWFIGFLVTRFYNDLVIAIGDGITFWIFGVFCFVSALFVFFLVPETKGKSITEIHDEL